MKTFGLRRKVDEHVFVFWEMFFLKSICLKTVFVEQCFLLCCFSFVVENLFWEF